MSQGATTMALEAVTKEIEASAQKAVADIRAQCDAEISEIRRQTDAEIAEMKEAQSRRTAAAVETLARQERSSAELESKKIVLLKKKEMLNRAFDAALVSLESMPADKKLACYKAMVKSSQALIDEPKAVMSVNDNFTAAELGVKSVEKSDRISAGLILRSQDGQTEVDMQYSVLLKSIWDSNLKAISDILFG